MARTYCEKPPPAGSKPAVTPDFLVDGALRVKFARTVEAVAAGDVVEHDDAIARLVFRHIAARRRATTPAVSCP